jgi:ribosomal protein S14
MTTTARNAKFHRQLAKPAASGRTPAKVQMLPRERIRLKRRRNLCSRARAAYGKFGLCRICSRNLAGDGLIPAVWRASW